MSCREELSQLRALQVRRGRAYTAWGRAFKGALSRGGNATYGDAAATITAEFAAVSTAARALQAVSRERLAATPPPDAATAAALRFVVGQVEAGQAAERQKYEATVARQRLLAAHARRPVLHDAACEVLLLCPGIDIRSARGTGGLDDSESDDDEGNGCAAFAAELAGIAADIAAATAAAGELAEELQATWSDMAE